MSTLRAVPMPTRAPEYVATARVVGKTLTAALAALQLAALLGGPILELKRPGSAPAAAQTAPERTAHPGKR